MFDTYEKCTLSKETRCALPWRYLMMRAPAQHNLLAARERGDGTPHTAYHASQTDEERCVRAAMRKREEACWRPRCGGPLDQGRRLALAARGALGSRVSS